MLWGATPVQLLYVTSSDVFTNLEHPHSPVRKPQVANGASKAGRRYGSLRVFTNRPLTRGRKAAILVRDAYFLDPPPDARAAVIRRFFSNQRAIAPCRRCRLNAANSGV